MKNDSDGSQLCLNDTQGRLGFPIFTKLDEDFDGGSYQESHLEVSLHPCLNGTFTRALQLALTTIPPASFLIENGTDTTTNSTTENSTDSDGGGGVVEQNPVEPDAGDGGGGETV